MEINIILIPIVIIVIVGLLVIVARKDNDV
jgi:hypothetical protein